MSKIESADDAPVDGIVMPSIELALIRWSVVGRKWHDIGGDLPMLSAFLAGWFCRSIGATEPVNAGQFRDSFRAGWREADEQATIAARDPWRGCDGPCESLRAWCPECDCETDHTRISQTCRECRECGELTADFTA